MVAPRASVMTTLSWPPVPLAPLQLFGSCRVGKTVPAMAKPWQPWQDWPGRIEGPSLPFQRLLLVHTMLTGPSGAAGSTSGVAPASGDTDGEPPSARMGRPASGRGGSTRAGSPLVG